MAEDKENIFDSEEFKELFESLDSEYTRARDTLIERGDANFFIANTTKSSQMIQEVVRRLYEEHRGDGNMFPIILGTVSGAAVSRNLLCTFLRDGADAYEGAVCHNCTIPLYQAWTDVLQREEMERELNDV